MNSCARASLAAAITGSIGMAGSASAILSRTERLNSTFSCNTTPNCRRSQAASMMARSTPSTNTPTLRHVEPLGKLGERTLARARGADDADDLTGRHAETDVRQHFRPMDAVAEGDMLERDVAADRGEGCPSGIEGWFRRGIEDIAEPRHRQAGLMKILPDLGEPQHRRAHPSGQHIE